MDNKFIIENGILKSAIICDSSVIIPMEVKRIGNGAFKGSIVKSVSFKGNQIKSIDEEAFRDCKNLKSIMLPNGLVQIGDYAFYGCSELRYIRIPKTVIVVGNDIIGNCHSDIFVLGEKNSEAVNVAENNNCTFHSNISETLAVFEKAENARLEKETKSFDIFGETITCSNTLSRYNATLEYYSGRSVWFYNKFVETIPMTTDQSFGDILSLLENEQENTKKRLYDQGVFILPTVFNSYILEPYKAILAAVKAIKEVHSSINNNIESDINNYNDELVREAESKVTGLSYGFIGGGLEMVAYSIDDFREKQRQRKAAYAVAEKKSADFIYQRKTQGREIYAEFMTQALPYLNQGTDMYINALCRLEIDQLCTAELIEESIPNSYDIEKSNQLVSSVADKPGDNTFSVALALKKYPCNIAAFVYAIEHKYDCPGLNALLLFLGIKKRVDSIVSDNKNKQLNNLTKDVRAVSNGNDGVNLIKINSDWLDDQDVKTLLSVLSIVISPMIQKIIDSDGSTLEADVRDYCECELPKIITQENLAFFKKYSVEPTFVRFTNSSVSIDYSEALNQICEKTLESRVRTKSAEDERKNKEKYNKALEGYYTKNPNQVLNAKKLFEELSDYKDAALLASKCDKKVIDLQNKKKRNKKIKIIVSVSLLLIIIVIVGLVFLINKVLIPNSKLNEAKGLAKEMHYSEAIEILKDLDNNSEAQELMAAYTKEAEKQAISNTIDKAQKYASEKQYKEAILLLDTIKNNEESKKLIKSLSKDYANELAESGKYMEAAGVLMNSGLDTDTTDLFKDYIFKSKEIVSTGENFTVALKQDGTVLATGKNDIGQCDVSNWNEIVSVSAGQKHTVGLKKDGTVVATGDNSGGQCEVALWKNIIAISAGYDYTVGVTSGGSVVLAGCYENDVHYDSNRNIVIDKNTSKTRISLPVWNDIVSVSAGRDSFAGLTGNMSVVCAGFNGFKQSEISNWKTIKAISSGYRHSVGLTKDGKVCATGQNDNHQCEITEWNDIVSVSAGYDVTIGLKKDGTTEFSGPYHYYSSEQELSNIISISASTWGKFFVFVKSNGSVVAYGNNSDGQCNVSDWKLW